MRVRVTALALVLAVGGCSKWMYGYVLFPDPERPISIGLARVEVDRASLVDGDLEFRLLVGAIDGGVLLDRRLVPSWGLEVTGALDCDGGGPIPYFFWDYLPPGPSSSSMVEIRAGEWFGKDVRFPLFVKEEDGGGVPNCVDATFTLNLAMALNPHVPFRVTAYRAIPEFDAGQEADAGQP